MASHNGRQGIGVLAFKVDNVRAIRDRYRQLHPALIDSYVELPEKNHAILEVFAYYKQHSEVNTSSDTPAADTGTVLCFVEFDDQLTDVRDHSSTLCALLGMTTCDAVFDDSSMAAFCDHWVSNVCDRTEFLSTLHDTLGFTPKVDFNAGVVAAGEAQIESTVTGNTPKRIPLNTSMALRDQSQVYLPINNALSFVGHVHGYLKEIGQGVQHVASRVNNLVEFVQRCNEYREITGEGFTFLRIPRSYYGVLTFRQLMADIESESLDGISDVCAKAVIDCLEKIALLAKDGTLNLDLDREHLCQVLDRNIDLVAKDEYFIKRDVIVTIVLRARYRNLYNLLGCNISEDNYIGIVRNQILVDIQGGDLLYQIFTSNILQRSAGEEAPFFEFIQRVCSKDVIKSGCGGFGKFQLSATSRTQQRIV
jgi:hypothetical protein